jgi:hypothetical protein
LPAALLTAAFPAAIAGGAAATPIDEKYAEIGAAAGRLGTPTGSETAAPDHVGKLRPFAHGAIYWHPATGAHAIEGLILRRWGELGGERGYLGYPTSDELDTFDHGGRVSKFQGGELIWRPATNKVSEVKASDLIIDLPFPPGQSWYVIQANAVKKDDSHTQQFAYCWDFMLAGKPQAASNGALFVAAADGPILYVEQRHAAQDQTNVIVQRWGAGRYASYLHIRKDSYTRHFGASAGTLLPQAMPFSHWPVAKSGAVLAEVGDVGAPAGAFHLHFCVTTKPDRDQFGPFESVPVSFRNYSVSTNEGRSWSYVAFGVPRREQWLRRETRPAPTTPQVNETASVLSFGKVKGEVSGPLADPAGGKLVITVHSNWGEPLASTTVVIPATGAAGPWPYEIADVPAFNNLKVSVIYEGSKSTAANPVAAESGAFELKPNGSAAVNVRLKN